VFEPKNRLEAPEHEYTRKSSETESICKFRFRTVRSITSGCLELAEEGHLER
jgi:hypothetical protein